MKANGISSALILTGVLCGFGATSQSAFAEDWFDGIKPREVAADTPYPANSTIGGYAVYQGDGHWRVLSNKVGKPNSFGVSYGTLALLRYDEDTFAAEMATTVNLNQSAQDFFLTTSFCAGPHLVKVELISILGNQGTGENCLTIDPYVGTVGNKRITTLATVITNTQSAARFYQIEILLNPAVLGFPDTVASDWTTSALAANPERKQLLDRMTAWAKHLQGAVKDAIAFRKPADAFNAVPSWRALAKSTSAPKAIQSAGGGPSVAPSHAADQSVVQRLAGLQDHRDQGLITFTEY